MTNICVLTNSTLAYCILAIVTTIGWSPMNMGICWDCAIGIGIG
jgi:hypothetical protein